MSDSDWDIDTDSITLPQFAAPNDPAVIIGPDLPPCMQAAYSSAIFFRSPNTVTDSINGQGTWFIAQRKTVAGSQVEEGWALWDQGTVCGYIVVRVRASGPLGGGTGSFFPAETWGDFASVGDATFGIGPLLQVVSSNSRSPATFAIGNAVIGSLPDKSRFLIDGTSVGRGVRSRVASAVSSAAIGVVEAVVLTTPSQTFFNGRAYRWQGLSHLISSVAGNNPNMQIRSTNLAGQILDITSIPTSAAGPFYKVNAEGYFVRTAGTDLTTNLVQTLLSSVGNTTQFGGVTTIRSLDCWDCGAASDFIGHIAIV